MPEVDTSKLEALIAKHNIKKKEVAELLDLTYNAFYRKMNSKRKFTLKEAKELANFFGVTIDDLFFSDEVAS